MANILVQADEFLIIIYPDGLAGELQPSTCGVPLDEFQVVSWAMQTDTAEKIQVAGPNGIRDITELVARCAVQQDQYFHTQQDAENYAWMECVAHELPCEGSDPDREYDLAKEYA